MGYWLAAYIIVFMNKIIVFIIIINIFININYNYYFRVIKIV